jgi:hypothetical protein
MFPRSLGTGFKTISRWRWQVVLPSLAIGAGLFLGGAATWQAEEDETEERAVSGDNCSYSANPDEFLARESGILNARFEDAKPFKGGRPAKAAAAVQRRNFIDNEILTPLEAKGTPVAQITDDYEFARRVYLDFTGAIPTPEQVRAFVSDRAADKRAKLVETLVYSPEFNDRWMMVLGEWFGITPINVNLNIGTNGRNAFYFAVRERLQQNMPVDKLAWEMVAGGGNNWQIEQGLSNFTALGRMPGGPRSAVDEFDAEFVRTAGTFLGMAHYDCILCHNGRGHLERVSQWGSAATRVQAWEMASFFSKTEVRTAEQNNNVQNYVVWERRTGPYPLGDTQGNRPARSTVTILDPLTQEPRTLNAIVPRYRTGGNVTGSGWRASFADYMVRDRMFARNAANRLWREMFGVGLVEPVDSLDPARLDPNNPPSAASGWTLQASHPVLLEKLADELIRQRFNLREFVRFMADSSVYQLSSRYDGAWNVALVNTFARHIPRRLTGEEVFDAVSKATGTVDMNRLYVRGWASGATDGLKRGVQLPDPSEPGNNAAGNNNGTFTGFANQFIRGNRDNIPVARGGSVLMQLTIMNNAFVTQRTKTAQSARLRQIAAITDDQRMIEELWLSYLGRLPNSRELGSARDAIRVAPNRNAAVEDLSWVLVNRVEFLFSY